MDVCSETDLDGAVVTVFGGTGFIGSRIVEKLLAAGARVRVATRHPQSVYGLRIMGSVGQIAAVPCSYVSEEDVDAAVKGSDMVVNCMGILYEKKSNEFSHVHTDLPHWIAKACTKYGVMRFVHISALGVNYSRSEYAVTKLSGEHAVAHAFPAVTILRPSVVFGPEDNFFNKFASLARFVPALPLLGGGYSKFQPVYVGDVAAAVVTALTCSGTAGKTYELGGPDVMTLKGVYKKTASVTGLRIHKVYIPWWFARIQAFFFGLLPKPLLTNDQITSLRSHNIVHKDALTFSDLGISPRSVDEILPTYLGRYLYRK